MANARLKVAVLDDFEGVMGTHPALADARNQVDMTVFDRPLGTETQIATALSEFDAVCLIRERTAFPASLIERLPNLKFLAFTGARNPSLDAAHAATRQIPVSNTPGGPAKASTAEQTWALLLAATKHLVGADSGMRDGHWRQDRHGNRYGLPSMLEGEKLGLVGVGEIGSRVGAVGNAFGMQVVGWSPNLTQERATAGGATLVSKAELFAQCRFISLHLVLSDRTRGIVSAQEIESMREDAVIVNTSRAGLIDTAALIAGLKAGRPAHAALDVFTAEPLAEPDVSAQLLSMPNVTLSPHLGYVTERVFDAFAAGLSEIVLGWTKGESVRVINEV